MKYSFVFIWLFTLSTTLFAQEPAWLDPMSRANTWPEEEFLVAFGTEVLTKKQSESEAQQKLYEVIKGQISDAILVSINAQTSLNITVENAATDERLQRKSASASEVELVGLKLDSYYDKRKKSVYAFGYVSIEELSKYHRNIINSNSSQVNDNLQQAASTGNKNDQIKRYVDNKALLTEAQKSIRLLTALSQPHGADVSSLQQTASKNDALLDGLFRTGKVTVLHLVTRLSGELLNALPRGSKNNISNQGIPYHSSRVTSQFSESISKQLETQLSESNKLVFSKSASGKLTGSFIQSENETIFSMQIANEEGEVIAATDVPVNSEVIEESGLDLLPPNFIFIPRLADVSFDGPPIFSIKPSEYTSKPIEIIASVDGAGIPNLALDLIIEKDGDSETYETVTDDKGQLSFNLDESMVVPGNEYLVRIEINLERFLSIKTGNEFLDFINDNQSVASSTIALTVKSPTVYISSAENGINGPLGIKVLEPAVKAGLSNLRYAFIEDQSSADYELVIDAKARKGQAGDIATLTFVDATISLVNRLNGKEIYKNSFFNVKGIGANFDVAEANAFQKTKKQLVDDITYELEFNR